MFLITCGNLQSYQCLRDHSPSAACKILSGSWYLFEIRLISYDIRLAVPYRKYIIILYEGASVCTTRLIKLRIAVLTADCVYSSFSNAIKKKSMINVAWYQDIYLINNLYYVKSLPYQKWLWHDCCLLCGINLIARHNKQSIRMSMSCFSHFEQFMGRKIDNVDLQWPEPKLQLQKSPTVMSRCCAFLVCFHISADVGTSI